MLAVRTIFARRFSTTITARVGDFSSRPGPPPLPAAEQAEFERLVKEAEVAPPLDTSAEAPAADLEHRDLRRGAKPEFEGEVNPKTGEVGGPKRDPFMAGENDWQFGGRVTVSVRDYS